MKHAFFPVVLATMLSSTAAFAADTVYETGAAETNWNGAYIGAAIGYGWLNTEDLTFDGGDPDADGFSGSVFAGYNYQAGNLVVGAEADIAFGNVEGSNLDTGGFLAPLEQKLSGSIRARAGYALGNVLPYLTAGLAISEFEADHDGGGSDIAEETLTGYVLGAGVDVAFSQNIFGRLEYQYADYGTEEFGFDDGSDIHDVEIDSHTVRLGIAYKF